VKASNDSRLESIHGYSNIYRVAKATKFENILDAKFHIPL
jgi:hypothetical protein